MLPESVWWKQFCMEQERFLQLCEKLPLFISPKNHYPNYRKLSDKKKMIANIFGIYQRAFSKLLPEVCTAIVDHLLQKYTKLLLKAGEMRVYVSQFECMVYFRHLVVSTVCIFQLKHPRKVPLIILIINSFFHSSCL